MDKQLELLRGTLDMLILKGVSHGPPHGCGVLLRIQQISKDRLEIQQGSLYLALYRLEHQGWITSESEGSENNARQSVSGSRRQANANCSRKQKSGTVWLMSSRGFCTPRLGKYDSLEPHSLNAEAHCVALSNGERDGCGNALPY